MYRTVSLRRAVNPQTTNNNDDDIDINPSTITAQLANSPDDPNLSYQLGRQLCENGFPRAAATVLVRAHLLCEGKDGAILEELVNALLIVRGRASVGVVGCGCGCGYGGCVVMVVALTLVLRGRDNTYVHTHAPTEQRIWRVSLSPGQQSAVLP